MKYASIPVIYFPNHSSNGEFRLGNILFEYEKEHRTLVGSFPVGCRIVEITGNVPKDVLYIDGNDNHLQARTMQACFFGYSSLLHRLAITIKWLDTLEHGVKYTEESLKVWSTPFIYQSSSEAESLSNITIDADNDDAARLFSEVMR